MAENRVIGRDGGLPWRLPADMRRFKHLTMGHPIVMGRRTYDTLPGPLSGRRNVIVTRSPAYHPAGIEVVHSFDAALDHLEARDEVFIAGGEQIYRLALPQADRIYLTLVHAVIEGDTRFPPFAIDTWRLVEDLRFAADERHGYDFSFRRYERRATTR
jgi:dihydrofolate reductase